jgi:hypothetical protein
VTDSNELRRSAHDLVSSGNSIEGVAGFLGLPPDKVLGWERQAHAAADAGDSARDTVPSTDVLASRPGKDAQIEPSGFIAQRPMTRSILIALPLVLAALAFMSNIHEISRQLDLLWLYWLAASASLTIGALSIAYGLRAGFELTGHSMVFRNAISTRQLAYADVSSYSVVKNPSLGVYLLNFTTRSGLRGMQIWLEPWQIQGGFARWLALARCTHVGAVAFYHGNDPDRVKQEWSDLLKPYRADSGGR